MAEKEIKLKVINRIVFIIAITSFSSIASAQSIEADYVTSPRARVVFRVLETFKVQKLVETTENINVRADRVYAIRISADRSDVEVVEARALLENGREIYMDQLTGNLREGRAKTHVFGALRGRRVEKITIRAVSRSLIGSRGELSVAVGVIR